MSNELGTESFAPLANQVAGCHSGTPSSILTDENGHILKPYKPKSNFTYDANLDVKSISNHSDLIPITLNELHFYDKVKSSQEEDYVALRKISPLFIGSKVVNGIDHIVLEDFTSKMDCPCVMDVKIGKERYYPGRSEAKAANDKIKYPCLQKYGFCIAGIRICKPECGSVDIHYMPKETRQFTPDEVAKHINNFLHYGHRYSSSLRQKILSDAMDIQRWSAKQKSIILRGSSLLVVYDAADLHSVMRKSDEKDARVTEADRTTEAIAKARVGMIDFAHAFHLLGGEHDENYLEGMNNLVYLLQNGTLPPTE